MRSTDDKDNQLEKEGITRACGVEIMVWKGKFGRDTLLPSCPGEGSRGSGVTGKNTVYLTVRMCVSIHHGCIVKVCM